MNKVSLKDEYNRAFEAAVKALREKKIIIYPTDTVYGIGGVATSKEVVDEIYRIKKRDKEKPLSVLVGNLQQLQKFFKPSKEDLYYIYMRMPGPYTFILDAEAEIKKAVGYERVGVRVPDNYFARKLALEVEAPIITTSANISGKEAPKSVEEICNELKESVALVVDGGKAKHSEPSTVVDIKAKKIIRKGAGEFAWREESSVQ